MQFRYSDNLFAARKECGFYFYKTEWSRAAIMCWTETSNWRNFYWGISNRTEGKLDGFDLKKLNCMDNQPTDYWPYGWSRLIAKYSSWTTAIMPDIVDGKFADYVEKSVMAILQEINSENIKM